MPARAPVLILASDSELPEERRVWGRENRSLPATDREGLDWLTLCRFLGWAVEVHRGAIADAPGGHRIVILARDPEAVTEDEAEALASRLGDPALLVARVAPRGNPLAHLAGASSVGLRQISAPPRWAGPGASSRWRSHLELELARLELSSGCVPWAFCGAAPLVVARPIGEGAIATLAAHPGAIRDANPSGTGALRQLLAWGSPPPAAWIELEGALVLRMDDPGSAANAHLRSWAHRTLDEREWAAIAADLDRRQARMTIGYVPGWLDDGDPARGALAVGGVEVERAPGLVHPSPAVRYVARGGGADAIHDHEAEFRGLQALRAAAAGEVEPHGHTHVRPDHAAWASAPDRYDSVAWYRELEGFTGADGADPVGRGVELVRGFFGTEPAALACPGQTCSERALESALEAGLALVAAETLAIRDGERFCWDSHVTSPGIEWPNGALLETGIPVVACLHDRDPILHGSDWIGRWVDEWRARGARRLIDLRELAATLDLRLAITDERGEATLTVEREGRVPPVRPLPILFRTGASRAPSRLAASIDGESVELVSEGACGGAGRVLLAG